MAKIEVEIQQKSFNSEYIKANINILFTGSWLQSKTNDYLKPFNLSLQQFNILRILKGKFPEPASVKSLTAKMIDKTSNTSRLVDKLELKGLVVRVPSPEDRRRVDIRITDKGKSTVDQASVFAEGEVEKFIAKNIDLQDAIQLNRILDILRG